MGIWKFLKDYFTVGEGYFTVEPEPMLLKENKKKKKKSIWSRIVASSKEPEPEWWEKWQEDDLLDPSNPISPLHDKHD